MKRYLTILSLLVPFLSFSQSYVPEQNNDRVKVKPVIPVRAYAFNLKDVKITGGDFSHAMSLDSAYLLSLQPDRLLHRFHLYAGLPTKDSVYRGWESQGLSGHTLGHYLSAASMMFVSTGNTAFREKVNYIIDELEKCQQARKTGYIGAIPDEDSIFAKVKRGEIKSSGFDLNGGWSPWYTVHKVMAGLVDAYLYAGNNKALILVSRMSDWVYNTINHLGDSTRMKMLNCEYGGMNEVLVNVYAITGNKKYLDLSYKFYDEFVMGQLAKKIDPLPGKHSNTNVPKAIGSSRQYELTGNERDKTIASFFWENMVHHHSYVIGGNSNYEYCGEAGKLNDRLSDNTCETCNTYNMLKLTRHLFAWNPNGELMDYYERALYNHILASQNPEDGMMTYFVPLRMGTKKTFSRPFNTFTCCVGSGIENHSKYAEQIYSHDGNNTIWVNLFIPSRVNWGEKFFIVEQQTSFPASNLIRLSIRHKTEKPMAIRIRKPFWVNGDLIVTINGKPVEKVEVIDGYIELKRLWKNKDIIEVVFPMNLYTESMPDNPNRIAFKYGPLVLAGTLGKKMPDPVFGTPVLMTDNRNVNEWIKQDTDNPLVFSTSGVGKPFDVKLAPFYKVYDEYYSVYWDYFTHADWTARQSEYEAEKKRLKEIEDRTVDHFRVGEMQPERDHNLKASERSYVSDALGRNGREARRDHYFSFEMKVIPGLSQSLLLTYIGDDKDRKFDILVEGVKIATEDWKGGTTGKFYDVEYKIPGELINGTEKITVRIEANYEKTAGRVFGARIIK